MKNAEEIRNDVRELVLYIVPDKVASNELLVNTYTDGFMIACEEYAEQSKEPIEVKNCFTCEHHKANNSYEPCVNCDDDFSNHESEVKPILKFNDGRGAILCINCHVIIKENLTIDEWDGKTNLLYCKDCKKKP